MDERYQKFVNSWQEPLRLSIALESFFQEETDAEARTAYGQYLRRRFQPAVAALVAADDTARLAKLAALGRTVKLSASHRWSCYGGTMPGQRHCGEGVPQ